MSSSAAPPPLAFAIHLDSPCASAGDFIRGVVVLHLAAPLSMRALRLHAKGTARARFPASQPGRSRSSSRASLSPPPPVLPGALSSPGTPNNTLSTVSSGRQVTAKTPVLDYEVAVFGSSSKGIFVGGQEVPAGMHEFRFAVPVPSSAPSSYESAYARVRYKLRATIDRPFVADYVTGARVIVACTLPDPATAGRYLSARECHAGADTRWFIFSTGRVQAALTVNQTILVPPPLPANGTPNSSSGPEFPPASNTPALLSARFTIDNGAWSTLREVRIALVRRETVAAEGRTATAATTLVSSSRFAAVMPRAPNTVFEAVLVATERDASAILAVPSLTCSGDIIRVAYSVDAVVTIKSKPLVLSVPILVCPAPIAPPPPMPLTAPAVAPHAPVLLHHTKADDAQEDATRDAAARYSAPGTSGFNTVMRTDDPGQAPPPPAYDNGALQFGAPSPSAPALPPR
ncbi:hypothetical protein BC828DRAFT_389765 [Blastocladiella britannica]|nr:hypothetical protein BC828DRAFT_389765 [Blastocladiella britannica]